MALQSATDAAFTTGVTNVVTEASGGRGAFFWTDFAMSQVATLNTSLYYRMIFTAVNYTNDGAGGVADMTVSWTVYSVA